MGGNSWTVRLSAAAEADYRQILRWMIENFGSAQPRNYADTLSSALQALGTGPSIMGVKDQHGPRTTGDRPNAVHLKVFDLKLPGHRLSVEVGHDWQGVGTRRTDPHCGLS